MGGKHGLARLLGTNSATYLDLTIRGDAKAVAAGTEMIRHTADEAEAAFVPRDFPRASCIVQLIGGSHEIRVLS